MGPFVKPLTKRIGNQSVMRGQMVALDSGTYSYGGAYVYEAFLRNSGSGGGSGVSDTDASPEAGVDGQRGNHGPTRTIAVRYSLGLAVSSPATEPAYGAVPAVAQSSGGGYFAHMRGFNGADGVSVTLNGESPSSIAVGGDPGRTAYTSWPRGQTPVSNPDGSDSGRGGFGVYKEYSTSTTPAFTWREANAKGKRCRIFLTLRD